jgi:pyrroline-5-carboxylate reductase
MPNIGFIGAGNMGFAIIKGVAESGLPGLRLFAYDPDAGRLPPLRDYGIALCGSDAELVKHCDCVFLAVKPQQLDDVLRNIKDAVTPQTLFISICAGITEEYIAERTIEDIKVVLAMPNTPLLLGEGATALAMGENVTNEDFELAHALFSSCGQTAVIDKGKMKEVVAINGSSPAFIYLFTKALSDYAKSVGIDASAAKLLITQTLRGSAKMFSESGYTPDELIAMVASKGGTTEAGLSELHAGGFESVVRNACEACTNRAYDISS